MPALRRNALRAGATRNGFVFAFGRRGGGRGCRRAAGVFLDQLARAVQKFERDLALRTALQPVIDHRAAGRIFAHRAAAATAAAAAAAADAIGVLGLEEVRVLGGTLSFNWYSIGRSSRM